MRQVLIDTNIYVAFKRNHKNVVEAFRNFDVIGIDITVIAELLSGFKAGSKENQNRIELEDFLNSPRVQLIYPDLETCEFYSNIFISLKKKGTPIPTNDIWIASSAMRNGLGLFTLDNHFKNIEGLLIFKLDN